MLTCQRQSQDHELERGPVVQEAKEQFRIAFESSFRMLRISGPTDRVRLFLSAVACGSGYALERFTFHRSVSGVLEIVAAFVALDGCDEAADMAANVVDRALLGGAHPVLDFGEGLFDRIEVGGVSRQIPEPGADGFNQAAQDNRLVAAEIVHDDDVARVKLRNENLLDIGAEAFAVDWAVEQARCGEASQRKAPRNVSVRQ